MRSRIITDISMQLLIVESPTKTKTISAFLGKDFRVLSSYGHIRDLPKSKTGVDVEHDFTPTYIVPTNSRKVVSALKKAAEEADMVYLATDSDREGEAIAWHIAQALELDPKKAKRITFHEITKTAIEEAIAHPRWLDMHLVNAQQTRRILDRLVGYELSPLLWRKVRSGLSAGRVQSVAVRLVVDRERERDAFKIEEYWSLDALFEKEGQTFEGKLTHAHNQKLEKLSIKNEAEAQVILRDLTDASYHVTQVEKQEVSKTPPVPFTTASLQMEANKKLGFSAKQTMKLAQDLYETGCISYMRTDSLTLADKFLSETQQYIAQTLGAAYATGPKQYKTKKKGAQEAHEAIRPTDIRITPQEIKSPLQAQHIKLYNLIWRRTLASQLPPARVERTSVDITAKDFVFRSTGHSVLFDGFMKIYQGAKEKWLPVLVVGDPVALSSLTPTQHFTEPPARYSDATLVKVLEEYEIGRPSTYAPTIGTILDRGYVERDDQKKLKPTDIGCIVNDLLVQHFPNIVDYQFTAKMEKNLDEVAEGEMEWIPMLKQFYTPFHQNITEKMEDLKREDILPDRILGTDPATGKNIRVRSGRYGSYVQLGEEEKEKGSPKPKRVALPKDLFFDTLTVDQAQGLLALPRLVGYTKEGEAIYATIGRFGPYLKTGLLSTSLKPPFDLLIITEVQAQTLVTEAIAQKQAALTPLAEFGEDPVSHKPILLKSGRFGPYVTDGITNASLGKKLEPSAVTKEVAMELLVKKRARPPTKFKRKT